MNFDFVNWGLGILTAVIVAVLGRLVFKAISDRLEKKPQLDWFVLADFSAPEQRIHADSFDVFYAARLQDSARFKPDLIDQYRADLRTSREAVKIKIRNEGAGPSETVSLLLNGDPTSIDLSPSTTIKKMVTADQKTHLEIPAIGGNSSVEMFLYGVPAYKLVGVFHKGIPISKNLSGLLPYKRPRSHWMWALQGFSFGMMFIVALDTLVKKYSPDTELKIEQAVQSENQGEPKK
ncbi:hypothetical protein [Paenirhodobacter hankyongi]|uniref:hypothetical protein n=1 Tax=Paenirhodobacter hankyongi TaxID=2294033 RepID=UPI0011C46E10|nr:hypothetical protein [Sinirhodobacter hankyongi]